MKHCISIVWKPPPLFDATSANLLTGEIGMRVSNTFRRTWRRCYSSGRIQAPEPARKNWSFLLGGLTGTGLGLASSLYLVNDTLPLKQHAFGGASELARAKTELQHLFQERATVDEEDCIVHGSSSWFPIHNDGQPSIVVYPHTTEEVQQIARIATKYKIPVVSYGSGTSIEGQFSTPYGGICLDFSTMDAILEIQEDDMTVRVQPGVGWQALNEELDARHTGLFFPVRTFLRGYASY